MLWVYVIGNRICLDGCIKAAIFLSHMSLAHFYSDSLLVALRAWEWRWNKVFFGDIIPVGPLYRYDDNALDMIGCVT